MLTPQSHEATVNEGINGRNFTQLAMLTPGASNATTSLEGLVKDPSGAAVSGARVTIRNEETGVAQVATSDSRGHYHFNDERRNCQRDS
jgi:hypothetical protein